VRRHVARIHGIGLNNEIVKSFSGHSLRAGLITTLAARGVESRVIMDQSRHISFEVMRQYIRAGTPFTNNASSMAGL
jgi:integrase